MTNWPPLVWIGSLKLLLTTWTDIPGSIRIPLQLERCLVVILKSGIFLNKSKGGIHRKDCPL